MHYALYGLYTYNMKNVCCNIHRLCGFFFGQTCANVICRKHILRIKYIYVLLHSVADFLSSAFNLFNIISNHPLNFKTGQLPFIYNIYNVPHFFAVVVVLSSLVIIHTLNFNPNIYYLWFVRVYAYLHNLYITCTVYIICADVELTFGSETTRNHRDKLLLQQMRKCICCKFKR